MSKDEATRVHTDRRLSMRCTHEIDWLKLAVWIGLLGFCVLAWAGVIGLVYLAGA